MTTCICDTADYAPAHTIPVENPDGTHAGHLCLYCETLWYA
ncbi:hypothetical protein [Arthrobacter sp. Alg241-R88]|nr:hypothetical protein [Arthrobacter sp. Alg241-R88]